MLKFSRSMLARKAFSPKVAAFRSSPLRMSSTSATMMESPKFNRSNQFNSNPFRSGLLMAGGALALAGLCSTDETQCQEDFAHASRFPDLAVFSGTGNPKLAQEIANELGIKLGRMKIKHFADGEIGIRVKDHVRGKDVYVIQPTCPPGVNDHLMELLLMISTLRRASAGKITAVIPYYGYARQDRKMQSRVPISAADVARLIEAMGVDRVVAVDLHCGQIQGFFSPNVPVDNLEGHVVGLDFFMKLGLKPETTKVVSPDAGGVYRAKQFKEGLRLMGLDSGMAMIIKERLEDNKVSKMDLVGDVEGFDVIMVDDMIDTAGTLTKAAGELKMRGANRVFAFASHGLFSGPANTRIENSCLEKVVVTNSVPLQENASSKITQLSIAPLLAESIARIHLHKSVSALFYQGGK